MMPGAETLVKTFGATAGGREDVIKLLKDGHLVGVAPGHSDPKSIIPFGNSVISEYF